MTLVDVTHLLIFFGGGLALLLALSRLLEPEKRGSQWMFIFLLSSVGFTILLQLYYLAYWNNPGRQPAFIVFLIGPFIYFYFQYLTDENFSFDRKMLLHFLPAVINIFLGIIHTVGVTLRDGEGLGIDSLIKNLQLPYYFNILGLLLILVYIAVSLWRLEIFTTLWRRPRNPLVVMSTVWLIFSALIILFGIVSISLKIVKILRITFLLISIQTIITFLLGNRYPQFIQWFTEEVQKNKYHRSQIGDLDSSSIEKRLRELMEFEKIFCDEELTLNALASELDITSHQLSEFLNSRLDMNFNYYINRYRIEEAKAMLLNEPGRPITSVSYAVGFNTKSVFNEAFLKQTGMSPRDFRKKHMKSK